MAYQVDKNGYYGNFGGAFIPELLHHNINELKENYLEIINEKDFKDKFKLLLKTYVGRPTPLYYAKRLSAKYKCAIHLKREDLCHTGAHKINNTIGQILLAKRMGKTRIIAETGAGQHGVATATVCAFMDLKCVVYMGAKDVKRQALNVARMKMLGAEVRPEHSSSQTLKDATNAAMRDWINHASNTHYIIGSVVGPHPYPDMVTLFQSVISEEIKTQLQQKPNYILACVGGGSNAAGAFYHFLDDANVNLVGIEAGGEGIESTKTAATLALGSEGVLHGSKSIMLQTKDGQVREPHSISAGLDYPGIGPLHAHLSRKGRATYYNVTDKEAIEAALELSRLEGIIPALESAHAFAVLPKMTFKNKDTVVINLSGRGDKDISTYKKFID